MILKKGEIVYLSETGNNGFYYPSVESETLLEDVEAKSLAWAGAQSKSAFLVPCSSIYGSGKPDIKTPVWVEKKSLMGR